MTCNRSILYRVQLKNKVKQSKIKKFTNNLTFGDVTRTIIPFLAKKPFEGSLRHFARTFRRNRSKIAHRLANPNIKKITFHSLRHYKASKEYAKTKSLVHVQQVLGHRSILSTMIYTHIIDFREDNYHSATAKKVEEASKLVEAGFEHVCDFKR